VYERYGASAHPHGPEWEAMMRVAGFEPRVSIPVVVRSNRGEVAGDRVVRSPHQGEQRRQAAAEGRRRKRRPRR